MVTDEDLIEAVREFVDVEGSPVATPDDVARQLPVKRETVRQRLLRLAADNHVRTRKAGKARLFWIPDALRATSEYEPDVELPEELTDAAEERLGVDDGGDDRIDELIEHVDVPGWDDDVVDDRRAAMAMTLRLLEERGPMRRREILDEVYPEHPGDYGSPTSLWQNYLQGALSTLADEGELKRAKGTHDDDGWGLKN